MPRKTKVEQVVDEDGYALVPKEVVQPAIPEVPVVAEKVLRQAMRVPREQTERQKLAAIKMVEANKIRWAENKIKKEEQAKLAAEEAKRKRKEQEEALIAAGTHVRVKVAPKRAYRKSKAPPSQSEETATDGDDRDETSDTDSFQGASRPAPARPAPSAPPSPVAPKATSRSRKAPPPPSESETETDGEYKSRERVARRDVKKNLQALRAIDEALSASSNPYSALIASRWR